MPETQPFGDMSPAIVAMLRDEANLTTARHVLEDARQDLMARWEQLRAQRPAFGILGSKKSRDEYAASLGAVESQIASLDLMLNRVAVAHEGVQPALRAGLVSYLVQVDPMYRQGLKASRFHEYWHRAHSVVADRMKAFVRDLREVRKSVASDLERGKSRHSTESSWHLVNTRNSATELDREIEALNKVTQDHHAFVVNTPFAQIKLPFIEPWVCIKKMDMLWLAGSSSAIAETDQLLAEFVELRTPILDAVLVNFEAAANEHAQLAENRLRQCWSTLLAHAEAHLVSDAELEPTLSDIETRLVEAIRDRVSQQATRPFDSER